MRWLKRAKNLRLLLRSVLICWGGFLFHPQAVAQGSSVLNTGVWYKLGVTKSGVYRVDVNQLKAFGVNVSEIIPDQIQLYGNGGAMLPQRNNIKRAIDLVQNAILVKGEEDGKFDTNDAIYFYAEGPHVIRYDSTLAGLTHLTNCYSDTSYYFLTFGKSKGLRIKSETGLSTARGAIIDQFTDYWYHEEESVNLLHSGRDWWGEYIASANNFTIQADIPGVVPSSVLTYAASAIGTAQVPTRFDWKLNGQTVGQAPVGTVSTNTYDLKAQRTDSRYAVKMGAGIPASFVAGVNYDKNGQSSAQAYLNYVALQTQRTLKAYDDQQIYRFLPGSSDTVTYQLQNIPADWVLWNISNPYNITASTGPFSMSDGRRFRQYLGFKPDQAFTPASWQSVTNQNISASEVPDLLIVTASAWESEARRLAAFRKEHDGLEALVVTTGQVFNEFSSGKTDITAIRDFVRYLSQKDPDKLKYLLLFGDATYDYKNLHDNQSVSQRNSWVPVYESRESLNPVYTYSSDDYFGFLEDQEGEWIESTLGDHTLDIGVGRLPVKSLPEARTVVDKLINYDFSKNARGEWRNRVHFVADDGDGNIHQQHADQLAQLVQTDLLPARIFLDAFPQTTTSAGQKVPAINAAIKKSINDGTLILNYTGHGGIGGWAEEQVLTLADMQSARGYNNLPLLITATCDFGRYDDPALVSGAELMVLSPRGAAIGAVSTTRPVYSSTNFTINKAFYESLIKLGTSAALGDVIRLTKNKSLVGSLNRNFALLGDPSMRLARGSKKIQWTNTPDTLRALQKVTLKGMIVDGAGKGPDAGFTGIARIKIFDKQVAIRTLGNEGDVQSYNEFSSKLFDGSVQVKNGRFDCTFIMPKDIDYRTGPGRASIYAVSADSLDDASGQLGIWVGGSSAQAVDITPPQIAAYMDAVTFKDGDVVGNSPVLFVKLSDENGINTSGAGIGHQMTMTLNDTLEILLNDYYTAAIDDFGKGEIRFPFENLPPGKYSVRIKVWDTYNNSSELAFGFQVGSVSGIKLNTLTVYPNPFDQVISFELNHNRGNEDVEVVFDIMLNNGQRLGSYVWQYYNSESVIKETLPSLRAVQLTSGSFSYIYQVQIRSLKDNSIDKRAGKLLRLR